MREGRGEGRWRVRGGRSGREGEGVERRGKMEGEGREERRVKGEG